MLEKESDGNQQKPDWQLTTMKSRYDVETEGRLK